MCVCVCLCLCVSVSVSVCGLGVTSVFYCQFVYASGYAIVNEYLHKRMHTYKHVCIQCHMMHT